MKRFLFGLLAASAITALAPALRPTRAAADVDVHINIPAPPVIGFTVEPEVVLVPQTRVYYVPQVVDYDMYRYGSYWYVNRGGYWYRSKVYRGPFTGVDYVHVPRQIVGVPVKYRHHPQHPPGPHGKPSKHSKHRGYGHR